MNRNPLANSLHLRLLGLSALLFAAAFAPRPARAPFGIEPVEAVRIPAARQAVPRHASSSTSFTGTADRVTGVAVPAASLSLPVVQQPDGDAVFVSTQPGVVTQFRMAAKHGVIGLLAHNYLSGARFFDLKVGQEVDLVYGDGTLRRYSITAIRRYQALSPHDPRGPLRDLSPGAPQDPIPVADVFYQIYSGGDRVVFQTCVAAQGNPSWGRLFVIAEPVEE